MNRQHKIALLLSRGADDERRLALDQIDDAARRTNTFGSKDHREKRGKVEEKHDQQRRSYEALTDAELDQALASQAGRLPPPQGAAGRSSTKQEWEAVSRWESEGGAPGAAGGENVEVARKAGDEVRRKQDSMVNVDDNASGAAASSQSAKDAAAAAANNPAEQGGQG